jgi:hypothetical protein
MSSFTEKICSSFRSVSCGAVLLSSGKQESRGSGDPANTQTALGSSECCGGILFVLMGQYLIWARFFYAAWKKKRTHDALTNRRVIVVQNGWKRQMASTYIDTLPTLIKEGGSNGVGTLRFAQAEPMWSGRRGWGGWDGMSVGSVPAFVDVEDLESVYRLVSDLREKARTAKASFWGVLPQETLATIGTGSSAVRLPSNRCASGQSVRWAHWLLAAKKGPTFR